MGRLKGEHEFRAPREMTLEKSVQWVLSSRHGELT